MIKVCHVPKGELKEYMDWLNTPGLKIPLNKTCVEFYLECHRKGQMRVSDYA